MLLIALALAVVVTLAGLVTVFVAFPHRGQPIPRAARLSDALARANDRLRL